MQLLNAQEVELKVVVDYVSRRLGLNILYDEQGNAFLGDFGIALEATESSGPEAALSPGSPAYASPEQIRQERLAGPADLFSLGVVLFECLDCD